MYVSETIHVGMVSSMWHYHICVLDLYKLEKLFNYSSILNFNY